jgi:hypothetical protein
VVLSIDEKSQIQVLDRTQPGLPIKPGRCQTMTHDYKWHGTTTLFAAPSVFDGTVIGRCMQRHRHAEFIRFLNTVERAVLPPTSRFTSFSATTPPTSILKCWPRWRATGAGPFTSPRPPRLVQCGKELLLHDDAAAHPPQHLCSVADLQAAINAYLAEHNANPKPFVWTKFGEAILAKLDRCPVPSV